MEFLLTISIACSTLLTTAGNTADQNSHLYTQEKRVLPSLNFLKRGFKSCIKNCQDKKICVNNGENKDWQWCMKNCQHKTTNGQQWDMRKLFQHVCQGSSYSAGPAAGQNTKVSQAAQILGLSLEGLNCDTINKKYRILALKNHPDKGGKTETMGKINAAVIVLRASYCQK